MKKFFEIMYGKELQQFSAYSRKQKAAAIYAGASVAMVLVMACSGSITAFVLALANMCYAVTIADKHIPNVGNDEC